MYKKTILLGVALSLATTLSLAADYGEGHKDAIKKFIGKAVEASTLKVGALDLIEVHELKDPSWSEYLIKVSLKDSKSGEEISSTSMFFTNGAFVSSRLYDVSTDKLLDKSMAPVPGKETMTKDRLVAGVEDAGHNLIIYTDPLCPFCKQVVPEVIKEVNNAKNPDIGVYIVNLALPMHPKSKTLLKVMAAESLAGEHVRALGLYNISLKKDATEKDILAASNTLLGTKYSMEDISTDKVKAYLARDVDNSSRFMVAATPTFYIDGENVRGLQKLGEILAKSK